MIYDPKAPAALPTVEEVDRQLADLAQERQTIADRLNAIERDVDGDEATAAEYTRLTLRVKRIGHQEAALRDEHRAAFHVEYLSLLDTRAKEYAAAQQQLEDRKPKVDKARAALQAEQKEYDKERYAMFLAGDALSVDLIAFTKAAGYDASITSEITDEIRAIKVKHGLEG